MKLLKRMWNYHRRTMIGHYLPMLQSIILIKLESNETKNWWKAASPLRRTLTVEFIEK